MGVPAKMHKINSFFCHICKIDLMRANGMEVYCHSCGVNLICHTCFYSNKGISTDKEYQKRHRDLLGSHYVDFHTPIDVI